MTTLPTKPAFYSIRALAALSGLPEHALRRMCRNKELPHCRRSATSGSKRPTIFVPREAVQHLLDGMAADCELSVRPEPEQSRVRPLPTASKRGRARSA